MEPRQRDLPVGMRFRPTDLEMAIYFLMYKVLGWNMNARTIPEDCHDIFSRRPRDLPGNPREREEDHLYFYCRKDTNQVTNHSHNLWTPIGEETDVLNPKKNGELAGIKRSFAFVENEEYDSNCLSNEEEPPKYNWFMDEIRLPSTVVVSDLVLCHVFCKKVKPEFIDFAESESEYEESVDKPAESLDFLREKDENVLPPPLDSP